MPKLFCSKQSCSYLPLHYRILFRFPLKSISIISNLEPLLQESLQTLLPLYPSLKIYQKHWGRQDKTDPLSTYFKCSFSWTLIWMLFLIGYVPYSKFNQDVFEPDFQFSLVVAFVVFVQQHKRVLLLTGTVNFQITGTRSSLIFTVNCTCRVIAA